MSARIGWKGIAGLIAVVEVAITFCERFFEPSEPAATLISWLSGPRTQVGWAAMEHIISRISNCSFGRFDRRFLCAVLGFETRAIRRTDEVAAISDWRA